MKKCPFCKAEIEDNARFCLYCMKPLNEKEVILPSKKKKPWWILAVAGVLLVLLAAILLIPGGDEDDESGGGEALLGDNIIAPQTAESTGNTTQDVQSGENGQSGQANSNTAHQSTGSVNTSQNVPDSPQTDTQTQKATTPPTPEKTTQATTPSAGAEQSTENTTAPTEPEETTQSTTQPETQPVAAAYSYRAARAGDDFSAMYTNSGSDIVITGIAQQSPDGVYNIPAYIDGQKVIAITANAFYGSGAQTVYLPATVKTVWNYAFNGCPLADIYFTQNVYIEAMAFCGSTASLTIHCPSGCQDRNLRTYSSSAVNYDAVWEEWNG